MGTFLFTRDQDDLRRGMGCIALPRALERKYPNAG
jgi:hypothetical protein